MKFQVAALCDAATDYHGKLNLLGTFDTIIAGQMPAMHPQCSLALRVVFEKSEEGAHQLKINFVDEDGKSIMPAIDLPLQIAVPEDSIFVSRNLVINIQQLKFDRPGLYSIDVALDNRSETSVPLLVKLLPPGQAPGESQPL